MATKKFDLIAQEFVDSIGARFVSAFTPGTMAVPATNIITAAQVIAYVNKALNQYFDAMLKATEIEGRVDYDSFMNNLPELVVAPVSIAFTTGIYTLASPHLHMFRLIGGVYDTDNKPIEILPAQLWPKIQSGLFPMTDYSGDRAAMIHINNKIYIYPATIASAYIMYIQLPKNGSTGELLTQNGTVDSPYFETRHSGIAHLAKNLYLQDTTKRAE